MARESLVQDERLMILSIRPSYVDSIVAGTKSVELRRTRPHIDAGQPVAIYATVPVASIVAIARVSGVTVGAPSTVWNAVRHDAGVTRRLYRNYFAHCDTAVAIHLDEVESLQEGISLGHLRRRDAFHPPQTWHFVDDERLKRLLGSHPAAPTLRGLITAS